MADHRAEVSTQATYPGRAVVRTIVQVGLPAFIGLLLILPPIIQTVLDGFGRHLPTEVYAYLAGAAVVITAVSATLARVMAVPGVIEWTRTYLPFLTPDKTDAQ
ncbi:hypothetical protein [Pseudarthrobacter sp. PS3-L1]|uniref:hypothetical protein n=1 Tax=Pseudarthrobacter sp. PS3-L1 TaxID=3046207 RepID=UPI0024B8C062|nr:hypothetical protein [Pseudarthrobacter sp. PS3-L1]MDJ0321815.1 hypothetical protein [Pseudarthrobacter sp. PS3-L1]